MTVFTTGGEFGRAPRSLGSFLANRPSVKAHHG